MPVSVVTAIIALILIGLFFTSWQRRHAFVEARRDAVHLQRMLEAGFESRLLRLAQDLYAHHPDLPEAPLVCAQALYRNEDTRLDAIPFLQNELQRDPSCWACRNLLMEIYQAKGDLNLAAGLRAEIEKTTPDTSDAWYVRSFATFDLPTALHCAIEAVNRAPDHVPSWYRLTYLKLVTNDLTGAIAGAERLIELGEDRADWTFFKGNMLASLGRFHEAIEQYSMVIDLTSGLDRGYMRRAHAYRRIKDYERAIEDYTRVLETSDAPTTVAWYLCQRAAPLRMLGRPEEALADYDRVRDLLEPPSYADARAFLILKELGRDDAADEVLTQALADVQDPWLRQIFLCLAGQVTPQRLIGDALASGNPDQRCEAFYYAGEVSLLAGQLEDARTLLQRCVQAGVEAGPGTPLGTFKDERELAEWRLRTLFANPASAAGEGN